MSIFDETKQSLERSGLGTHQWAQIANKQIPRLFIRLFIILFSILCCVLESVLCIKFISDSFSDCLLPFGLILTFSSVALIYICLLINTVEIYELLEYMETIINSSEFAITTENSDA